MIGVVRRFAEHKVLLPVPSRSLPRLAAWELPLAERRSLMASAMSAIMPGFSLAPGSERPGDPLEIVPYDPDWTMLYGQWRELFVRALGPVALRVEHVGSTSIPGLAEHRYDARYARGWDGSDWVYGEPGRPSGRARRPTAGGVAA